MPQVSHIAQSLEHTSLANPPPAAQDIIFIKNLQLPHGLITLDVWGQSKEQPALVCVALLLHGAFTTAAGSDKLDDSTIHYGTLAKHIRASSKPDQTPHELTRDVGIAIKSLASKKDGRFIVAKATIEVILPKASMYGDGTTLINTTKCDGNGKVTDLERTFIMKDVKIMTLVGVNSYERGQKQPVVATLMLHSRMKATGEDLVNKDDSLFALEQSLVQIIQETSFDTLEALAEHTVMELRKTTLDSTLPGTMVRLRIEKPRAIAFADAPAVEITREVPLATADASAANIAAQGNLKSTTERLKVVNPYV